MDAVEANLNFDNSYVVEMSKQILFQELDEAIDDMENGRVLSEEEVWAEIEALEGDVYGAKAVSD